jgi:predicted Zn-ribbon and HTH transcriptional regulator
MVKKIKKLTRVEVLGCEKCGYTWLPRVKSPLKCPKCGHRFDSSKIRTEEGRPE